MTEQRTEQKTPKTEEQVRQQCDGNADNIFVRDIVNGKVDSYSFASLPEARKKYWVSVWTERINAK